VSKLEIKFLINYNDNKYIELSNKKITKKTIKKHINDLEAYFEEMKNANTLKDINLKKLVLLNRDYQDVEFKEIPSTRNVRKLNKMTKKITRKINDLYSRQNKSVVGNWSHSVGQKIKYEDLEIFTFNKPKIKLDKQKFKNLEIFKFKVKPEDNKKFKKEDFADNIFNDKSEGILKLLVNLKKYNLSDVSWDMLIKKTDNKLDAKIEDLAFNEINEIKEEIRFGNLEIVDY
jgi:hypothetical protein